MLYSKWENFNRCSTTSIHVCKKLPLAMDCRQSKYALSKFNIYIFQFWTWLLPFLFYVIFRSSKSVSQILKISFQTGNINIFVLRGVFFSGNVQLKSSFSDEKIISEEITIWWYDLYDSYSAYEDFHSFKISSYKSK